MYDIYHFAECNMSYICHHADMNIHKYFGSAHFLEFYVKKTEGAKFNRSQYYMQLDRVGTLNSAVLIDLSRECTDAAMNMRSTLGYGFLEGHSLLLPVSWWLKHRRSATGAEMMLQRQPGSLGEPARVLQLKPRLLMTYDKHIPGIYQCKLVILHNNPLVVETCFVCVDVMSYVSDRSVTCMVRCKLSASRLS